MRGGHLKQQGGWSRLVGPAMSAALLAILLVLFTDYLQCELGSRSLELDWRSNLLATAGLFFYLTLLPAFRHDLEMPAPVERALVERPWLRWVDRFAWAVLGILSTAAVWLATAQWPVLWLRALTSMVAGSFLTRLLARLGWALWEALLPSYIAREPAPEWRDVPFLRGGVRTPVVPSLAQRARIFWLGRVLPGAGLAGAFLAPFLLSGRDPNLSSKLSLLATLVLVAYPLICRLWQTEVFPQQLEWVPGTGLLLLHSRPWERARSAVLGNRADLQEVKVVDGLATLTFPDRTLRVPAGELSEGLCTTTRKMKRVLLPGTPSRSL